MLKKLAKPLVLATAVLAATTIGTAASASDYILNTASTGGTYHPVGTAIATLSKIKLLPKEKFSLTAVNSAGSGANVQALAADTAQFAILQGLFGSYAATGTGPVTEKQENMRSITMLWQNVEHFILANDHVESGSMSDLESVKGETVVMGKGWIISLLFTQAMVPLLMRWQTVRRLVVAFLQDHLPVQLLNSCLLTVTSLLF